MGIVQPAGAPAWMAERETFGTAAEATEKRKDARQARGLVIACRTSFQGVRTEQQGQGALDYRSIPARSRVATRPKTAGFS